MKLFILLVLPSALSSSSRTNSDNDLLFNLLNSSDRGTSRRYTKTTSRSETLIPIDSRSSSKSSGRSSSGVSRTRRGNRSCTTCGSTRGASSGSSRNSSSPSGGSNSSSRRSSGSSSRSDSSTIVVNRKDIDRLIQLIASTSASGTCTGNCAQGAQVATSSYGQPYIYYSYLGADGRTYYVGTDRNVYYWSIDGKWTVYDGTGPSVATEAVVAPATPVETPSVVNNYYTYTTAPTKSRRSTRSRSSPTASTVPEFSPLPTPVSIASINKESSKSTSSQATVLSSPKTATIETQT